MLEGPPPLLTHPKLWHQRVHPVVHLTGTLALLPRVGASLPDSQPRSSFFLRTGLGPGGGGPPVLHQQREIAGWGPHGPGLQGSADLCTPRKTQVGQSGDRSSLHLLEQSSPADHCTPLASGWMMYPASRAVSSWKKGRQFSESWRFGLVQDEHQEEGEGPLLL